MSVRITDERLREILERYAIEVTWCEEKVEEYQLALEVYERREVDRKQRETIQRVVDLMQRISGVTPGDYDGLKRAVEKVYVPEETDPEPELADWERRLEAMEGVLSAPSPECPAWICTACGILERASTGKKAVRKAYRKWSAARSADIWRPRDDER